jgi:hypothetical protein
MHSVKGAKVNEAHGQSLIKQVLNVNVPPDATAGQKITAVASSGDEVIFTLPKGVAPGTRLQMIPTRQVMKRGGLHALREQPASSLS